eukprot:CAMPEP_0115012830 /NCGR_PEP_ID=MMETSP0216-20121206/24994_1 /TAXON_ID=223996 /ORGANISM="Protocruzia adherens, Strain Boccale" /LENGTH=209 /DNA_ID=CAMNT_0002382009 /DNA_START=1 /DNA_END=630 /DNA_ORIENTATION=+
MYEHKDAIPWIEFYNGVFELTKLYDSMGTFLSYAFSDITTKIDIIKTRMTEEGETDISLQHFVLNEKKAGKVDMSAHNAKSHPLRKEFPGYISVGRTLTRLIRFLAYVSKFITNICENPDMAPKEANRIAYDECAAPMHNFAIRCAAKLCISMTPQREHLNKTFLGDSLENYPEQREMFEEMMKISVSIKRVDTVIREFLNSNDIMNLP